MRIHFAETLRALDRLGGGIFADEGQTSAQPWSLGQIAYIIMRTHIETYYHHLLKHIVLFDNILVSAGHEFRQLLSRMFVRNGSYSKWFGKWSGARPAAIRDQVAQELGGLTHLKGVSDLRRQIMDGSSGEAMIIINACKAIHVLKNWSFHARSHSAEIPLLTKSFHSSKNT